MNVSNEGSKDLVPFREPADTSQLVLRATENLQNLSKTITYVTENQTVPISIDKKLIDEIVNALKELDAERQWLHEAVEEETIRSSVFRHKLGEFPRDIEGEIRDAVRSARYSNDAVMHAYKEQLRKTEQNIVDLEKQYELLSVSNVTLGPENMEMKAKHNSHIENLNQILLEKASMQIKLNETRETLNDNIIKTKDYRQAIADLKEDMIEEQREARVEDDRLKQEINVTSEKINEQRKKNSTKKGEVEAVQLKHLQSEDDLEWKRDVIRHHEANELRLKTLWEQHEEQLKRELEHNLELQNIGEDLRKQKNDLETIYGKDKKELERKISSLDSQLQLAQNEYDQVQSQKIRTTHILDGALLSGRKDKDEAQDMQKSLRVTKDDLLHQTSECTRLKRENIELEILIEKTLQDHIGTTDVLNKQIQTYQQALLAERKERQLLQSKRDEINKEMSDYMTEFSKFNSLTTKSINEGKAEHQSLNVQGVDMQKKFKEVEQIIQEKQTDLQNAKGSYMDTQKKLKEKIKQLKESIAELETDVNKRKAKYEKELPVFHDLQVTHKRKTEEFDQMKKLIVEVKTTKATLESTVEEKQRKLENMDGPKNKVEEELQKAREEYLEQLKNQSAEMKNIENEIYDTTKKCQAVQWQNERFRKAIEFFKADIEFMGSRMKEMSDGKKHIDLTIGEYRDWLELQWRKHMQLDKEYHDKDVQLLDDIKKVETATSLREKKLEQIHYQLEEQLNLIGAFIDGAADLRVFAKVE